MIKGLNAATRESLLAVLPISIIVLILSFTPLAHLETDEVVAFIISAIILIIGIALFTQGANMAIKPIGGRIGSSLLKQNKLFLLILITFIMGFLVAIAESDLSVLLNQVHKIFDNTLVLILIGIGLGLFAVLSVIKIIFKVNLQTLLLFSYLALFGLTTIVFENGNGLFLPLAFDAGYATSGSVVVPFMMAYGVGLARIVGGRGRKDNSFGVIALCTIGPIMMVLIYELHLGREVVDNAKALDLSIIETYKMEDDLPLAFLEAFLESAKEVAIALGLIAIVFLILNFTIIKLPKDKLIQFIVGLLYTFVGHVLFLTGAKVGYLPIGFRIGESLAENNQIVLVIVGFILGVVTVFAEPNVHIVSRQIEEVTTGGVTRRSLLIAICVGVGISTCLSLIRVVFEFSILYYIIPIILISFLLSFFVPKIYTAIAFDSGAVASGPLTVSFILPLAVGACSQLNGSVLYDGFGLIAMVSMVPVITIQTLGFRAIIAKRIDNKRKLKKIISSDDEQIINFM